MSLVFPEVIRLETESAYESTLENLLKAWGVIAIIGIVSTLISIISLKIRNRGS